MSKTLKLCLHLNNLVEMGVSVRYISRAWGSSGPNVKLVVRFQRSVVDVMIYAQESTSMNEQEGV